MIAVEDAELPDKLAVQANGSPCMLATFGNLSVEFGGYRFGFPASKNTTF